MNHHAIVQKLTTAWSSQRAADVLALYTADATLSHPMVGPDPLRGREAIAGFEQPMFAAFSDIEWRPTDSFAVGDRVAVAYIVSATNSAPMQTPNGPVPATGRRVNIHGTSLLRLAADGSIAEEKRFFDALSFMTQLGLAR